jgi:hypothetical protein
MIAKCETWEEIANYGVEREAFFRRFLDLPNGAPSHDTINRVFHRISFGHFPARPTSVAKLLHGLDAERKPAEPGKALMH